MKAYFMVINGRVSFVFNLSPVIHKSLSLNPFKRRFSFLKIHYMFLVVLRMTL